MAIPLRFRVPNPPANFVDREDETASLAGALREFPATLVTGPDGVGKSALVVHALHKRLVKRVDQSLYLTVSAGMAREELGTDLLRALATAMGETIDWPLIQDDPDAVFEAALDLAESGKWLVVLDDLHHLPEPESAELLEQLARYARQSHFVATVRRSPIARDRRAELPVQEIELAGLSPDHARAFCRSVAPDASDEAMARALSTAGGSPRWLRAALRAPVGRGEVVDGLSESARKLAAAAAWPGVPAPREVLAQAARLGPTDVAFEELIERGWLLESPAGLTLHDVPRATMARRVDDPDGDPPDEVLDEARRVGRALANTDDLLLRIDGARLMTFGGAEPEAERVLDDSLSRILAEGHAPKVWRMLSALPETALPGIRLRCAAELGNPTVLRQVSEPPRTNPAEGITWAETLFMRGDLDGAEAALERIGEPTARQSEPVSGVTGGDWRVARELLRARILLARDEVEAARQLLEDLSIDDDDAAALRDALLTRIRPPSQVAPEELRAIEARCGSLGPLTRAQVRFHLAAAHVRRRNLQRAEALLPRTENTEDALATFEARRALWLLTIVDLAAGRLDGAETKLDKLAPFLRSPSLIRAEVRCTRAHLDVLRGDFGKVLADLEVALTEAKHLGVIASARHIDALKQEVEQILLLGEGGERRRQLAEQRVRDIAGWTGSSENRLRDAQTAERGVAALQAELEAAEAALLAGSAAEVLHADAALSQAKAIRSPRFEAEASLLGMTSGLDWARLEVIAARDEVSPRAARRARALLDPRSESTPKLDALDEAVVDALRRSGADGGALPETLGASTGDCWIPGWGLDEATSRVWLPDGEWVEFKRRAVQLRLIVVLAQYEGQASKETLVREVWDEPDYHPLRHDSRLQVTVRKLRELIEREPSEPARLLTTTSGYALGLPFRRLRSVSTH